MADKSSFRAGRDNAALSENVELLTGQRGDGLDRAITLRELNRLGLATLSRIGGIYTSKNGTVPGSATPGVVDFPGKPANVLVNGAFNTILIQWDEPNYRGHAYTEVWRAETDNLAVAVMIGTSSARMYSDPIGGDAHVYYWVRFVNKNDTKGPFNATAGTYGETAVDIGQLLDALSGQIAESQLAQTLLAKVDKIALIDRIGKFRVLSSGYGGGTSSVTNSLNETIVKTGARSWNLVVISKINHSILFTGTYDVFASSTNAQLLADKLNSYADYSCVAIIFTYDEPRTNLIANLKTALVRYGATQATLDGIVYRGAYVLAGIPGIGAGNGEEYVKNIEAGHIETVISLTNGYLDGQSSASVSVVVNEIAARIDADSAMASNISTVSAVANAKNKTFLQTAAPTSGMVTGDLWYDTDDNNKTYRYSGSAWVLAADARIATNAAAITTEQTARANGDSANASAIQTVQTNLNGTNTTVSTLSSSVSYMDANGSAAYRAMWAVKGSVGNITAGIGLMVSGGVSQVMVSASQFYVFDPNATAPNQALFSVVNGAVVIRKALIESATIETVQAMTITADYVVSGISITTPNIVGGTLSLGSGDNSLFADGSLGIGKGGPYGGWGWGWHTIIYSDGSLCTDRLYASAGSFTGTVNANAGTFNNVTINENCDVKGTIYANKIVGDVVAIKNYNITAQSAVMTTTLLSGTIISSTQNRILMLSDIRINRFSTVNKKLQVSIYVGGVQVWHGEANSSTDASYTANPPPLSIASGANRTFSVSVYTSDNSYLDIPAQDIQCTVVPASSGTFA